MPRIESHIREVAQAQGITSISALARKAQLNRKTVARLWKRDMPPWVKFSTITKICHALGDASIDVVIVTGRRLSEVVALRRALPGCVAQG